MKIQKLDNFYLSNFYKFKMKNQKSIIFLILIIPIILSILTSASVFAASLSFVPSAQTVSQGDSVFVYLNVSGVSDLYGFQVDIIYDASLLRFESLTDGNFLKQGGASVFSISPAPSPSGLIEGYAVTRYGEGIVGISGNGNLAIIEFTAADSGTAGIELRNPELYTSSSDLILHTTSNATVTIQAPCTLASAYWSKTSAVENEIVSLIVNGSNCLNKQLNYTIWKNVLWWFDKKVFTTSSSASTTWNAGKKSDGSFEIGDYYFIAILTDDASVSANSHSNRDLNVKLACVDADKDGYNVTAGCGAVDCNDNNANIYPGATELCNGVDDNCVNGADESNGECSGTRAICSGGRCVECVSSLQCSDNLYCDGQEICSVNGVCNSGFLNLSDNIMCTDDTCNEADDKIIHTPINASCNNGLYCDGTGYCNVALKKCEQINPQICNDGILCTLDSCSEGANLFDNLGSCVIDISNCACTKNLDCNDANVCTDNFCTGQLTCQKEFNTNLCNDNLFCTENDKCALGNCAGTLKDVNDNVKCTIDSCNEVGKNISHVANNAACNNGLYCDGVETCSVLSDCKLGIAPTEDDGFACTVDVCNEAIDGFNHVPDDSVCDDKKYCTIDSCVGSKSYDGCSHSERDCSDGNATTFDYCNETAKTCSHSIIVNEGDDEDGDGIPDEIDKCPGTKWNIISNVNKYGCPLPVSNKFDIITNLTNLDLWNVSNFEIGIKNYGEIRYPGKNLSLIVPPTGGGGGGSGGGGNYNGSNYSRMDFDSGINISQYKIELDSSSLPQMNKSAEIIFFNISFISPKILRNRENCSECVINLWNSTLKRFEFSVLHFTSYEVVEGYSSCGNLSCDSGESCSNCPSDCGNCPTSPPSNQGNNGGGGGGGGTPSTKPGCVENWTCGEWAECSDGKQLRVCEDKNKCGTENIKLAGSKECEQDIIGEEKPKTTNALTNITSRLNLKLVLIILGVVIVVAVILIILILRRIKSRRIQELKKEIRKKK